MSRTISVRNNHIRVWLRRELEHYPKSVIPLPFKLRLSPNYFESNGDVVENLGTETLILYGLDRTNSLHSPFTTFRFERSTMVISGRSRIGWMIVYVFFFMLILVGYKLLDGRLRYLCTFHFFPITKFSNSKPYKRMCRNVTII